MNPTSGNAPDWDRFAHWPRLPALVLLAVTAVLLVLATLVPIQAGEDASSGSASETQSAAPAERPRDDDLLLYDGVIVRLQHGQGYYDAVVAEHRQRHYPLRPGLSVRLPTLAVIEAKLALPFQIAAAVLLLLGVLAAWWRKFGEEPGGAAVRTVAMAALFFGASIGTIRYFYVLHELWVGSLLALSFGLYRPTQGKWAQGKWLGAFTAAAAALALRETALPFVMLMAAYALWHRRWKEAAAWLALIAVFAAGLAWHLHIVAQYVLPSDPAGASWLTLRGLGGWLSMIVLASNLRWLPHTVAGPIVILMMLGWASWRTRSGSFGTMLLLGYGCAFMIAGRPDNWYWGMVAAPTMFVGLAFLPNAMPSLWRAGFPAKPPVAPGAGLGQS
ncbi:MAG: hypothetical protein ABI673_09560 [Novosphingobium sp.]